MQEPQRDTLVSVIVPIYNAQKWLRRCLDSIVCQTFNGFELILVDDGSIDNSLEICNSYAQNDSRIKVISKSNGGVSSARNVGIESAYSKWITFIDADDWVERDYLDALVSVADANNSDFVCANSICHFNGGESSFEGFKDTNLPLHDIQSEFAKWLNHPLLKVCHGQLYNAKLLKIHNIRFNEKIRLSEDSLFVLDYLAIARIISLCSKRVYHYDIPAYLTFKYKLSLKEAEYKAYKIDQALVVLSKKYELSLSERSEQTWRNSLSCVDLSTLFSDDIREAYKDLYTTHCKGGSYISDEKCNVVLRLYNYLIYVSTVDPLILKKGLLFALSEVGCKSYISTCEHSKFSRILSIVSKLGNRTIMLCFIKILRQIYKSKIK